MKRQLASLEDWLVYIENLHPQKIDLSLDRIKQVATSLGILKTSAKVITVAGTNGKGSTVATLESIFVQCGIRVGCYTSPHLLKYNERIKINGSCVSDNQIVQAFEAIERARASISLSYFEYSTLAALLLFKHANLDVFVLEVGLGGRLDAVNIIDADIAIITSIDFDHTEYLGNTLDKIGFEKAGIIREKSMVILGMDKPPKSIIDVIAQKNCQTVYSYDNEFSYDGIVWKSVKNKWKVVSNLARPSVACALKAIECLLPLFTIPEKDIIGGVRNINLPGRFQKIVFQRKLTILDVAHNPQAANRLAEQLRSLEQPGKNFAVFAIANDKDIENTIEPMLPLISGWYVSRFENIRSATPISIAQKIKSFGQIAIQTFSKVENAYWQALQESGQNDRIIVFGSFLTVAEVINLIKAKESVLN